MSGKKVATQFGLDQVEQSAFRATSGATSGSVTNAQKHKSALHRHAVERRLVCLGAQSGCGRRRLETAVAAQAQFPIPKSKEITCIET
jgi:hypothetical protein